MSNATASSTLDVLASDPSITYLPAGTWNTTNFYGNLTYAYGNVQILYTFSEPATGIEWWGSKSGSGGNAEVCIDCPLNSTSGVLVDYTDPSAGSYVPEPGMIAAWTNLTYDIHNITIYNIYDPQASNGQGGYGYIYFEGFELTGTDGTNAGNGNQPSFVSAPATSTSASATSSSPATVTVTDFVTVTPTASPSATSSSAAKVNSNRLGLCFAVLAIIGAVCASL
ncbi:hypothetical protein DACRYDRAFT_108518 [Dacryopinax primogenitus]|uniref:Uncharacterized protein n=1 Tax=Dacryopinax primogenitus (strain DJM 731) TaxID=1858805 RepID=M5G5X5_DACPD|nr:uncharacterized protein DACRYDRAFT_108518 [Dacryopinax primogenitus]EJU01187.1 hypothetical protein DACRYDRAFT_108518 [Dacryopinax primogenitus]